MWVALVCSGSFEAGVGYPLSKFASRCRDRGDDDATLPGMREADLAMPSALSVNCISKP